MWMLLATTLHHTVHWTAFPGNPGWTSEAPDLADQHSFQILGSIRLLSLLPMLSLLFLPDHLYSFVSELFPQSLASGCLIRSACNTIHPTTAPPHHCACIEKSVTDTKVISVTAVFSEPRLLFGTEQEIRRQFLTKFIELALKNFKWFIFSFYLEYSQ